MSAPLPDAVVLVGGMGTRLRPVVSDRPKPLAPVAGRPFLAWLLRHLASQGVRRAVLSAGFRAEQIQEFADAEREQAGLELVVVPEPQPLGTAGALRFALSEVRSEEMLVLNGDSFCAASLAPLARARREHAARAVLLLTEVEDTRRYGAVELAPGGEIVAFREKTEQGGRGLINAGVYLLEAHLIAALPADTELSLERDVLPACIGQGLFGVVSGGPFVDIGTPESYAWANAHLDWPALTGPASESDDSS